MDEAFDGVYITPNEACRQLDCTPAHLREYAWQGVLKTVRIAGRVHLLRQEVEAMVGKPRPKFKGTDAMQEFKKLQQTYGLPR